MKSLTLLFCLFAVTTKTWAHPVIYQDGWAISSSNMPQYSNNYVHYSVTPRLALGPEHWRFSQGDAHTELGLLKANALLWRQNKEDSQANVYLHSGLGAADQEFASRGTKGVWLAGLEADWETRSLYTSWKHLEFHGPRGLDLSMTQGRIGFSPVMAKFTDLQTWFMLQGMVIRDVEPKLMLTPMLRFFYHNVLWEVGSSTRGDWMLNLMVHY
jgi:hypothetical protein